MQPAVPDSAERWDVVELTVPETDLGSPAATFVHERGDRQRVRGFRDAAGTSHVRFMPGRVGRWTVEAETSSTPQPLGSFDCHEAEPSRNRGPVHPDGRFHFAHADGTPFRPVGTTVYNWLHQAEPLRRSTLDAVTGAGFNKVRFLVLPQAGGSVEHRPDVLPFPRRPDGTFDYSRTVPEFFDTIEWGVRSLRDHGVQADVIIFHPYDYGEWGFDLMPQAARRMLVTELVARLAAYRNVWWSLANEYDQLELTDAEWHELGELVRAEDPYDHPRSIHNWMELFDNSADWITHASIQNGAAAEQLGRAELYRDAWRKPVLMDEIRYEGDIQERWGRLTAAELVRRCWICAISGTYPTHGESYRTASGSLSIVEGGPFIGESPPRLRFLRQILDEVPPPGLDPIDKWNDPQHVAGVDGQQYLIYFPDQAPPRWTFCLPQGQRAVVEPGAEFTVQVIDTWAMTIGRIDTRYAIESVAEHRATVSPDAPSIPLPRRLGLLLRIDRCPT